MNASLANPSSWESRTRYIFMATRLRNSIHEMSPAECLYVEAGRGEHRVRLTDRLAIDLRELFGMLEEPRDIGIYLDGDSLPSLQPERFAEFLLAKIVDSIEQLGETLAAHAGSLVLGEFVSQGNEIMRREEERCRLLAGVGLYPANSRGIVASPSILRRVAQIRAQVLRERVTKPTDQD